MPHLNNTIIEKHYKEIQELYLKNDFPWVIGFSGGKDSSATLQLVFEAMKKLDSKMYHKDIWVLSSDTKVEIPSVVEKVDKTLSHINKYAKKNNLPFKTQLVTPDADSSFFVNIIGRGYPAPTRTFRWCTDRLKIKPASKFIEDKVSEYGSVVVVLGNRKKESISRAQSMANHQIKGNILKKHSTLSNAFVYTPIEDWDVEDVWGYLSFIDSPWGENNEDIVKMYQKEFLTF